MPLDELIDTYCAVWSSPEPAQRQRLLEAVWAPRATYVDPALDTVDGQGLLDHIARIQLTRPGAVVRRCTPVDAHHGLLRFGFEVIAPDGTRLRHGTDFAVLGEDGSRLERVIGFFGDLPTT